MGCGGSKAEVESHQLRPVEPCPEGTRRQDGRRNQRSQNGANVLSPPPPSVSSRSRSRGRGGQDDIQSIRTHHSSQSRPRGSGSKRGPSPDQNDVLEATRAVSRCLNKSNMKYAIVGGAGLMVLGSLRTTDDVDFVVFPPTVLTAAKNELLRDPRFVLNPRTRHVTFRASSGRLVEIAALSSPGTFRPPFDGSTQVMVVGDGVRVPNAPLFLASKCEAWSNRTDPGKRLTDGLDVQFILDFMVRSRIRTSGSQIPYVTPDFVARFDRENRGSAAMFHQVGII